MHNTFEEEEEYEGPSKSQIKREAEALVKLAKRLIELPNNKLAQIDMPDELSNALTEAKAIKSHIARKRQLKFVGKMMREIDTSSLTEAIDALDTGHQQQTVHFHKIEQWRDKLIEFGDSALHELVTLYPQTDRQNIRQLIRKAHREQQQNRPLKSKKELFKLLREIV